MTAKLYEVGRRILNYYQSKLPQKILFTFKILDREFSGLKCIIPGRLIEYNPQITPQMGKDFLMSILSLC